MLFTPATAVLAQQQAEWQQNYEAVSRVRVQRSTTPILSAQTLASTEEMIERYRDDRRAAAAGRGFASVLG